MKRAREWAPLAALVGLFLFAASRSLTLPGLWYDEAADPAYGMELALGLARSATDWSISLGGSPWPLRVLHPYDFSAFSIYWSALAFRLAGVSVATLRWAALLVCAGMLVCLYGFCRAWFSRRASLAVCALLAAHPAFLLGARLGFLKMELFAGFFALAALWLASLWRRGRAPWALCAAAFALGLSANVSTKALAFILALPALGWLWAPAKDRPSGRLVLAAAGCAVLGALNPILYCALHPRLVRFLLGALAAPTRAGVDNLAVLSNLRERASQLAATLGGACASEGVGAIGISIPWAPAAVAAGFAFLAYRAARERGPRRRLLGFLLSLPAALLLETCLTPMNLNCQHLLVVLPFALLVLALALEDAAGLGRAPAAAAGLVLAALLVAQARVDRAYFSALRETGGAGAWSDAVYDVARYLDGRAIRRPICLSWGLARNLYVASAGRVAPIEGHSFREEPDPEVLALYERGVRDPASRYLSYADGVPSQGQRTGSVLAFRRVARGAGLRLLAEREFKDRAGRSVIVLWRAAR